jgi:hypothetical protein
MLTEIDLLPEADFADRILCEPGAAAALARHL